MISRALWTLLFWQLLVLSGRAQMDDFNDGNDTGWSRLDPIGLAVNSPFASYQVSAGRYRLSSGPSPDPQLGPARVATYRADHVYGSFVMVVDLVSWNASLDQAVGMLARIQPNPGPGATDGYSLNYQPDDHDLEINRLAGEVPTNLVRVPLNLPEGESFRIVFCGQGDQLTAAVYALAEPLLPVVTLAAADSSYESGYCGLFAYDASGVGSVDATYDNYSAGPGEVPALTLATVLPDCTVRWPRRTGAWHLESSPDLQFWSEVTVGGKLVGETLLFAEPVAGRRYYRLAEGWQRP
jgi:hypothetical protein